MSLLVLFQNTGAPPPSTPTSYRMLLGVGAVYAIPFVGIFAAVAA